MKRYGILYVISAPSGAGKTSLCKEIIDIFPELRHSVSYTTRPARAGEVHGRDYFFVDEEQFRRMIADGEFAEWAQVHGNLYGTSRATLDEARENGVDLILDIDCQGARQLKQNVSDGVFIFILPPSIAELSRRLSLRNTDSPEVQEVRLQNAAAEMRECHWYDYLIVNDQFSQALQEFRSVVLAERCRTARVVTAATEPLNL